MMVVHIEVPGEIAKALAVNTTLTALYLYDNSLGEGAGRSIGQALGVNTTLTQLDLGHNSFRKRGGQAIGKALAVNTTLTQLELAGNSLREGGGQAIGHALALNTTEKVGIESLQTALGAQTCVRRHHHNQKLCIKMPVHSQKPVNFLQQGLLVICVRTSSQDHRHEHMVILQCLCQPPHTLDLYAIICKIKRRYSLILSV
jgi:hypothetical protein